MGNFYQSVVRADPRFTSPNRCADLALLEPVMRQKVLAILDDAEKHGQRFMIYETFRSQARQEQLFKQGVTQLKTVGVHHYALAADIVHSVNGEPHWDGDFTLLWHLAHVHSLISGHDWGFPDRPHSFRDSPHLQRCAVSDQPKLFDGSWFPGPLYSPYSP